MAIIVRLVFDVQVEGVDDTDENVLFVKEATELVVHSKVLAERAIIELVGLSRAVDGPMQGNLTVEPVISRSWRRVEHQEAV